MCVTWVGEDECRCSCHSGQVAHCMPCCARCWLCGKLIMLAWAEAHNKACRAAFKATEEGIHMMRASRGDFDAG